MVTRFVMCCGLWLLINSVAWAEFPEPVCSCESSAPSSITVWSPVRREPERLELVRTPTGMDRWPLQIIVPERLLNRLVAVERSEAGPVRDVIANTDVVGRQITVTRVQADCRPNDDRAEINLVLQGTVQSDTLGVTRQASVNTLGRHGVVAVKTVLFDGRLFFTRRPQVWVDVHNQHVGATTQFDGMPFLHRFARNTALSTAERLRPQADAETGEHLAAQIGPQFNQDADQRLGQWNRALKDNLQTRYRDFWPNRMSPRTTDSHFLFSAAWADAPELAVADAGHVTGLTPLDANSDSITVRVHESVLNSALQRLKLEGKTFSEPQVRDAFESFVAKFSGRVLASKKLKAAPLSEAMTPQIRFADKDAVRLKIAAGKVLLIVNASVEVAGQTVLAQDEITVPLTWAARKGEWQVDPGMMAFARGNNDVSLAGMMETLVRSQLAEAIPATVLPQSFAIPLAEGQSQSLRFAKTDASAGWLTLSLDIESNQRPIPNQMQPIPEEAFPLPDLSRSEVSTTRRLKPISSPRDRRSSADPSREGWTSRTTRQPRDSAGWFE